MLCEICELFPCTQSHPLQCPNLKMKILVEEETKLDEKFIYGNIEEQLFYVKIYKNFWDLREKILNEKREKLDK